MNKLLVITVLVALLALSAESFRVPRQAEEEEPGTFTKLTNTVSYYYDSAVGSVSGYLDSIRGLKLEEKMRNAYTDTVEVLSTYSGVASDQIYHTFWPQQ
ncbi:apolipoprotein C-II [Cheilinus undulatus]|uniref:apolipoprotein C-II n=1 Tax=Cheilinus undulatus TaxID=241271 RepID=UPI001BD55088|nr:apolipoprotein C-II [Cheilinus undulatus]